MSQITATKRRLVSLLAALTLAFSMLGVAPMAAFATADSAGGDTSATTGAGTPARSASTITATTGDLSVAVGSTLNMYDKFLAEGLDTTCQHIDFKITNTATDTGSATISKHPGVLTGSSAGTVTVTAYLVNAVQQPGVSGNPCQTPIASATKQVTITPQNAYGYQGNDLMIQMTSFSPAFNSYSSSTGYSNSLTNVTATNDVISFNYLQNYGIGKNTISQYQALNAEQIVLKNSSGTIVKRLGNGITLAQQGSSKTALIANVASTGLASGVYTLSFLPDYVAGNETSYLDTTVSFQFTL